MKTFKTDSEAVTEYLLYPVSGSFWMLLTKLICSLSMHREVDVLEFSVPLAQRKSSTLVMLIAVDTEEKCSITYTGKNTKEIVSDHELRDDKIKGLNLLYTLLILESLKKNPQTIELNYKKNLIKKRVYKRSMKAHEDVYGNTDLYDNNCILSTNLSYSGWSETVELVGYTSL